MVSSEEEEAGFRVACLLTAAPCAEAQRAEHGYSRFGSFAECKMETRRRNRQPFHDMWANMLVKAQSSLLVEGAFQFQEGKGTRRR